MARTVAIPVELFKKFLHAREALEDWHGAFEDYLVSANPTLLRKLRRARREHVSGKTRPLGDLRGELNLSPSARAGTRNRNNV